MKPRITIKPKLAEFLAKEEVLPRFVANATHSFRNVDRARVESVAEAFNWKDTPEGFEFWKKIDKKYINEKS